MNFFEENGIKPVASVKFSEEALKEVSTKTSVGSNFLGEGTHEDCLVTFELGKPREDGNGYGVMVEFSKDGKSKRAWYNFGMSKVITKGEIFMFGNLMKLFKGVFNSALVGTSFTSIMGDYILSQLKANKEVFPGLKATVSIGYGISPHAVKVEDPNDPTKTVIKIKRRVKKEGEYVDEFVKNESGLSDVIFDKFPTAHAWGKQHLAKFYKEFPEINRITGSALYEVPESIINAINDAAKSDANVNKNLEEVKTKPKAKPAPKPAPEPEIEEEEDDIVVNDEDDSDIFG